MPKTSLKRFPPTWDLYLITSTGNKLLAKNVEEKILLDKYFINLQNNILKNPNITREQLIESYEKLWKKQGELRCFYTDSWGHKWVCFPSNKKLLNYLKHYVAV